MPKRGSYHIRSKNRVVHVTRVQIPPVRVADTRFTRPSDGQINATLTEATRRVSAAVNRTRTDLRSARTAEHLLQFIRYPPAHALNLAMSAEIFEQTMEALLADVNAGHTYNISGDTGQY